MKKLILGAAFAALMTSSAMAEKVGVSMALFDDNFLTVLRNGIQKYADENGIEVQIEDAQNDVAKQLDQINNFIASGVDAIIVNPVDTSATQAMTDAAEAEGLPAELAARLARRTVEGAAALMAKSGETPGALRKAVTSPGGTTQAALDILMDDGGMPRLLRQAIRAAANRDRELSRDIE